MIWIIDQIHTASFSIVFSWGTLNRISYGSRIWVGVAIFIGDYGTSLNVNAVFWTNPGIRDRTALTTLVFRIWHAFIVVLIRILLDIVQINWIPVGLSSCRSWTLHYHILLMITILRSIWWNCVVYSHCGIVLVKNLLLSDNNLIWRLWIALFLQNLLLFRSVIGWMERMNRSSTLSWKLWPHLRRAKAIILAILLLSEVLFNLQSLSFRHVSLSTTQSISRLNSWPSFRGFYATTIDRWRSWSILRAFHFHFG